MTDLAALLWSLYTTRDVATIGVLADWLEEHGDWRRDPLRVTLRISDEAIVRAELDRQTEPYVVVGDESYEWVESRLGQANDIRVGYVLRLFPEVEYKFSFAVLDMEVALSRHEDDLATMMWHRKRIAGFILGIPEHYRVDAVNRRTDYWQHFTAEELADTIKTDPRQPFLTAPPVTP